MADSLVFAINGEKISIPSSSVDPSVTLNDFIRRNTRFTGTKLSCGEGGCGACAVDLARTCDGETVHVSVNSCLRPLASMDGWSVTTTEGIGGPKKGFHPIQERIAGLNGLQCGFCTPGMVMTAYSNIVQSKGDVTKESMEKSFDGNICRCTGYRPILDACKSLAKDTDIEDLITNTKCPSYSSYNVQEPEFPSFLTEHKTEPISFKKDGKEWIRPNNLSEVFKLITKDSRFVVANTSTGIYKNDSSSLLIDLQHIPELCVRSQDKNSVTVGGSCSITQFIKELEKAKENANDSPSKVAFLSAMITHTQRIANVHVRNVGSVAGNLALAKSKGFLSDLATILLGSESTVTMQSNNGSRTISMEEFLSSKEWNGELIRSITVPIIDDNQVFNSYKTAIRPVNSHAIINSAFKVTLKDTTVENITLAFGGVQEPDIPGSHAIIAHKTCEYLKGKELNGKTLQESLEILGKELSVQGEYKKETREKLINGFFYKFFISLVKVTDNLKSASVDLFKTRCISSGSQKFTYPENDTPISKAIPKPSGPILASGNALFIDDLPSNDCIFGALVTSTKAKAKIINIDASEALKAPGVIDFISSIDVPGENNCSPVGEIYPFFAEKEVEYNGQPIAMIVADTLRHAEAATNLVKIKYDESDSKPIFTTELAKQDKEYDFDIVNKFESGDVEEKLTLSDNKVSGKIYLGSQKHFYMEPQVCDAYVDEDNTYVIQSGGQYPHASHSSISKALGVPQNKVRLICRRAGGGFGGKLTHNIIVACACAVASHKTQRRVRVALNRNTDMRLAGGREETTTRYEVGFTKEGKITALKMTNDLAAGAKKDLSFFCNLAYVNAFSQVYDIPSFYLESKSYKTNQAPRTAVRGPSEISSSWCMETIIEHISHETKISVDKIREINFINEEEAKAGKKLPNGAELSHFTIPKIFKQISDSVNEDELRLSVEQFNKLNKWKKRGIAKTPVRYGVGIYARQATVNVYSDGSIVVHHSTSDIGQGANIKVYQAIALKFGQLFSPCTPLDVNLIRNAELDTNVLPNGAFTGGSTSSESSCEAAQNACEQIMERLKPIVTGIAEEKKEKGEDFSNISWQSICAEAAGKAVNLSAIGYCEARPGYQNYGGCLSVIELDTITGEVEILESHLVYDCGKSLNPAIDIGQTEGAFVMGLGFLLREEVSYDENGKLINDGTWEYKPPCYRDIPQIFDVQLLNDSPFEKGFLSSKASGEPPLVLANSVGFAIRQAIKEARKENGINDEFFTLNVPLTVDVIQNACGSPKLDL